MKKFIIDTSGKKIGLGFFNGKKTVYENYFNIDKNYNFVLINIIDNALKKSNYKLDDFDVFCSTLGPGSFTGIRVGISFIKAFALVFEKKVCGVSTLDIMKASINTKEKLYPAIDAKRREVYTIEYDKNRILYKIISIEKYIKIIEKSNTVAILLKDDDYLVETLSKNSKIKMHLLENIDLKVINNKIEEKEIELMDLSDLMPIYIRESDAETNLKKKGQYGKT